MLLHRQKKKTLILPLRALIGKAGMAGYLLLFNNIVYFFASRRRDFSEFAIVDRAAVLQVVYLGLCLLYVLDHLMRSPRKRVLHLLVNTPASLLLVYIGLCALSSFWSSIPIYTLYRSIECLTYLLLIAIVCDNLITSCSKQDFIEWLVFWSIWFLFWHIVKLYTMLGFTDRTMSIVVAFRRGAFVFGSLFFLTLFISKRWFFVIINVVFTVLSAANKTYFGIFFGLIPGLWMGDRRFHTALLFLIGLLLVGFLLFGSNVVQHTLFYGKEGIGPEHMSGRLWMWTHSLELGMKRPFYGHGFSVAEMQELKVIGAHNVFISAFLAIGIAGPILFTLFFAWLTFVVLKADLPGTWRCAFLATTIMILAISSSAPGIGGRVASSWIPVVFTSLCMCTIAESKRMRQLSTFGLHSRLGFSGSRCS